MRRFRPMLAVAAVALAACGDPAADPDAGLAVQLASVTERAEPSIDDGRDVTAVAEGATAFALDLYREVAAASVDGNVVVGPYSAWLALAMTSTGAAGNTHAELAAALHLPDLPDDRLLPAINALDRTLTHRAGDDVTFDVANRLWGQDGMAFEDAFLDGLMEHFGAPLVAADFAGDGGAASREINGWVAERTHDRIPELFPPGVLDGSTRLVLVNAMHLDAPWELAFDPENTSRGMFTRLDGSTVAVPLMHYDLFLPTGYGDDFVAVELPYEGGTMSMVVIVPADLAAFEAGLTADRLDEIVGSIQEGGIHLTMPTFSFSTHASLVPALEALGVHDAFGPADFSPMTREAGLFIDAVEHEAFVEVDEEGTEAAAATGVEMVESHGPTVDASRPFLFVIRDRGTGTILFLGRVTDPST